MSTNDHTAQLLLWDEPVEEIPGRPHESDPEDEAWSPVVGIPGYEVSTWGRFASLRVGRRRIMRGSRHEKGYVTVHFRADVGSEKTVPKLAHCVVMEAFVGPCPQGMVVRHLDGDRRNNRLDNLRYGTRRENHADRYRHGTDPQGERGPGSKLSNAEVIAIRREYRSGETQRRLADRYGIHQGTVSQIVNRKTWTHI